MFHVGTIPLRGASLKPLQKYGFLWLFFLRESQSYAGRLDSNRAGESVSMSRNMGLIGQMYERVEEMLHL